MKRVILLILIISLLSSIQMASYANEGEEIADSKYDEAFKFIIYPNDFTSYSLRIFGYMDPPFPPSDSGNRMIFVYGLHRLLGLRYRMFLEKEERYSDGYKSFGDVDEFCQKIINDIHYYDKDILKGYPDGSFRPNELIKYEEAVAMMVRALGYEKEMETRRYPIDYLIKAYEIGILENIEAKVGNTINFGIIAQLFLNSFEVELNSIPSHLGSYKTLLQKHEFQIYKDMTVVSVDTENQIVVCEDIGGTTEIFKYVDGLSFENLKGKKMTFWVDIGEDGRDIVFKGLELNKINDYIIRIIKDPLDKKSEFLMIDGYIDKVYDENGVEIDEPITDISEISQIKLLANEKIYTVSKNVIVAKGGLNINKENTLKTKEFTRIGVFDNKIVIIDILPEKNDNN